MPRRLSPNGVLTHVFLFLLFIVVPALTFVRRPNEPFFALTKPFVQDMMANAVFLIFFYLNYYLLLPRYFFNRKYFWYALYSLLFLVFALSLPQLIAKEILLFNHQPAPGDGPPGAPHRHTVFYFAVLELRRHLYLFFTAVSFSYLLRTRAHMAQLKEEKLQAQLSSLQAQINPHFLFNTLNSIYALSVKKDEKTSAAIIHLSGLMRYVIKDANDYKIPLAKEVAYINNYIELQKARLGQTVAVRFACSGEAGSKEITPLILITYIENAFKYGVNPDVAGCVVDVILQMTDSGIRLSTFNKKVQHAAGANATGIGMHNTGERLKHLYPDRHVLEVVEAKDSYSVTLALQLI